MAKLHPNEKAKKRPGRKPKFTSVEEVEQKIEAYFESCEGKPLRNEVGEPVFDRQGKVILLGGHPPTVTGLAAALGFHSRQSLINYQEKEQFADTILRAKLRIEDYCEQRLFDKEGQRGAEFILRYNFKWMEEEKAAAETPQYGVIVIPETGEGNA